MLPIEKVFVDFVVLYGWYKKMNDSPALSNEEPTAKIWDGKMDSNDCHYNLHFTRMDNKEVKYQVMSICFILLKPVENSCTIIVALVASSCGSPSCRRQVSNAGRRL